MALSIDLDSSDPLDSIESNIKKIEASNPNYSLQIVSAKIALEVLHNNTKVTIEQKQDHFTWSFIGQTILKSVLLSFIPPFIFGMAYMRLAPVYHNKFSEKKAIDLVDHAIKEIAQRTLPDSLPLSCTVELTVAKSNFTTFEFYETYKICTLTNASNIHSLLLQL